MIELTESLKNRVRIHEGIHIYVLGFTRQSHHRHHHLIKPHERERYAEGVEISMDEVEELFEMDLNRAQYELSLL